MLWFKFLGIKGGIPSQLMRSNNRAAHVPIRDLQEPDDAVRMMESQGFHVTRFSQFGTDPLASTVDLIQQRQDTFLRQRQWRPFVISTWLYSYFISVMISFQPCNLFHSIPCTFHVHLLTIRQLETLTSFELVWR